MSSTRPDLKPLSHWIDGTRRGDTTALAELYRRYADLAFAVAARVTGSQVEAQDVVQDVFVGLRRSLGSYQERGHFESWFKRCVARAALMQLRTMRRRREVEFDGDRVADASDISLTLSLERALAELSEPLRLVVVLHDVHGFTHPEIAGLLGVSKSASAMRLMRARKQLRNRLDGAEHLRSP